jgi:hypothetical protein
MKELDYLLSRTLVHVAATAIAIAKWANYHAEWLIRRNSEI